MKGAGVGVGWPPGQVLASRGVPQIQSLEGFGDVVTGVGPLTHLFMAHPSLGLAAGPGGGRLQAGA